MKNQTFSIKQIAPVLFCYFIMGFVDIVGTATSNIKSDLNLSNTLAGLLPNFIFIWFLLCSVPIGLLMNKVGRKNMVMASNLITAAGMLVPLPMITGMVEVSLTLYLITFMLLGIGNTILQVALNPLLTNVVSQEKLASSLTLGQFTKAISSLLGPQFVLFAATALSDWNYVFLIYAAVIILSSLWLYFTYVPREEASNSGEVTFGKVFALLGDKFLLNLFMCILLIVGLDVGLNFFIPIIFTDIYHMEHATNMNTLYFASRAVGSFICAFMLARYSSKKIFLWTMVVSILGMCVMMALVATGSSEFWAQALFCAMFLPVGFAAANVFSIVFSYALQHKPEKADQISSLLIMGVAGGGAVTLIMGAITDTLGIVGGMGVLMVCLIYIFGTALYLQKR